LRAVNAEQTRLIAQLRGRVAELERWLAKDSSTSSKPPSSDGLAKRPAPTRQRRTGGRRPGKQPGTPGAHLAQVPQPDQVVVHAPERCAGCGGDLTLAVVCGVEARQVFDLPPLRLGVAEHRAERRVCGCGTVTQAVFPAAARAAACYGPGVRALVAYLLVHQHLPVERAAGLLGDVLGARVATGTLAAVIVQGAAGLDGFTQAVREQLAGAEVAHFDETGARVAGRLHWVHTACTTTLSLFTVHPRRGRMAMDAAGVLPEFRGVAVHDGWSPYWSYTKATHALCNAHHLRELDAVAAEPGQAWAGELAEWLSMACFEATRANAAGADRLEPAILAGLRGRYDQIIVKGHAANPPPRPPRRRGLPKRSAAANLLTRLDTHRGEVLRFLHDLRVPFTNNQAELRHEVARCEWTRRREGRLTMSVA
jgi:transposase